MTERELLINKAKEYMNNAYAPYSRFNVAAICAERTAAVKAVSEGARHFKAIAVVCSTGEYAYPCGICRQFVGEFMDRDGMLYLEDKNEGELSMPFFDSIPYFFTGDRIK